MPESVGRWPNDFVLAAAVIDPQINPAPEGRVRLTVWRVFTERPLPVTCIHQLRETNGPLPPSSHSSLMTAAASLWEGLFLFLPGNNPILREWSVVNLFVLLAGRRLTSGSGVLGCVSKGKVLLGVSQPSLGSLCLFYIVTLSTLSL